jgi:DNA modification methylase
METDKIFNMDCLEGMKMIPDNSIDLIVTSPPYNNFRNRRTQAGREDYWKRTNIVYDCFSDKMTDEDYAEWQIKCINEMVRIIKPTGTIAYNHKDRIFNFEVLSPLTWILKTNATYRQRITWDRCGMQAYNPVRFYRCEEDIYILGKGSDFKWNKSAAKYLSIWKIPPTINKDFPCSFPEEIPKRCIEAFTDEGDIVLDPFTGSGTTAYVSHVMNRHYIGFEISEKYYEMAVRRIKAEQAQLTLF